jgi:hypothetical protein
MEVFHRFFFFIRSGAAFVDREIYRGYNNKWLYGKPAHLCKDFIGQFLSIAHNSNQYCLFEWLQVHLNRR